VKSGRHDPERSGTRQREDYGRQPPIPVLINYRFLTSGSGFVFDFDYPPEVKNKKTTMHFTPTWGIQVLWAETVDADE